LITNYFLNNLFIVIGSAKQRGAQVVLLKEVNLVPDSLPHSISPQNWEGKTKFKLRI
jgi:hypothetical protein